ncbi:hypothetical protein DRQ09_04385, partial [candidate division KSB1 bacterium]
NGLITKKSEELKPFKYYKFDLYKMINKICKLKKYNHLKENLHSIRTKTNFLIHGNKKVSSSEATEMLKLTLKVVQEL